MALGGHLHPHAKLDDDKVEDIVWRYKQGGNTYMSLANEFDVEAATIGAILRGKTWRHVTGGVPVQAPPRPLATHCAREHEFTPENTIWRTQEGRPRPTRHCRKCQNAAHNARRKRKRGNYR